MSNALQVAKQQLGAMSTVFADRPLEDDLSTGISGGFGHISFKGKVWKIHARGEETPLIRSDGSGDPVGSIEVVIVKASRDISKVYYAGGFVEGTSEAPDCMSSNGLVPDPGSRNPQHTSCALCPKNVFGSDIRQDGTAGKGKACKDAKRLAVVPLNDITNEIYGGAMLIRVPAASLQDLAKYGKGVNKLGYHYYGVGTRIGFDAKEAYPKLTFSPIRALTDDEARQVLEMQGDANIDRILAEHVAPSAPALQAPPPKEPEMQFEQAPPVQPAPVQTGFGAAIPAEVTAAPAKSAPQAQKAPPKRTSRAAQATPAAPVAEVAEVTEVVDAPPAGDAEFENSLDAELAALMG